MQNNSNNRVIFKFGTLEDYLKLQEKDQNTLYFISQKSEKEQQKVNDSKLDEQNKIQQKKKNK